MRGGSSGGSYALHVTPLCEEAETRGERCLLTVERPGVGSVRFKGPVDSTWALPDETVVLRHGEVIVSHPELEREAAVVELLGCWGNHTHSTQDSTRDVPSFVEKLRGLNESSGSTFLSYCPDSGAWTFEVEHFSRYGLDLDEEDEEEEEEEEEDESHHVRGPGFRPFSAGVSEEEEEEEEEEEDEEDEDDGEALMNDSDDEVIFNRQVGPTKDAEGFFPPPTGDLGLMHGGVFKSIGQPTLEQANDLFESMEEGDELDRTETEYSNTGLDQSMSDLDNSAIFEPDQPDGRKSDLAYALFDNQDDPMDIALPPDIRPPSSPKDGLRSTPRGRATVWDDGEVSFVVKKTPAPSTPVTLAHTPVRTPWKEENPFDAPPEVKRFRPDSPPQVRPTTPHLSDPVSLPSLALSSTSAAADTQWPQHSMEEARVLDVHVGVQDDGVCFDPALFLARSFRAGFSPSGLLVHQGKSLGAVQVTNTLSLSVGEKDAWGASKALQPMLELHLECSSTAAGDDWEMDEDVLEHDLDTELPYYAVVEPTELVKQSVLITSACPSPVAVVGRESHLLQNEDEVEELYTAEEFAVWGLIHAIWGQGRHEEGVQEHSLPRKKQLERLAVISRWLQCAVAKEALEDARKAASEFGEIFMRLTGKQVEEATDAAIRHEKYRMATLVSQAANVFTEDKEEDFCGEFRESLTQQLQIDAQYLPQFSADFQRLYFLLCGRVSDKLVVESLDWRRALGVQLWYGIGSAEERHNPHSALRDHCGPFSSAVLRFLDDLYAGLVPLPLRKTSACDMLFQLMLLYGQPFTNGASVEGRTMSLWNMLRPESYSDLPLDYALAWFVSTALSGLFGADNLVASSNTSGETFLHKQHALAMAFATELEMMGLWEWALYVLLHLPPSNQGVAKQFIAFRGLRRAAAKGIIARNVRTGVDERKILFAQERLRIPVQWVHESLAWSARSVGDDLLELDSLIRARTEVQRAHYLVVHSIGPDAVVSSVGLAPLKERLEQLAKLRPEQWASGGAIYLEYINYKLSAAYAQPTPERQEEVNKLVLSARAAASTTGKARAGMERIAEELLDDLRRDRRRFEQGSFELSWCPTTKPYHHDMLHGAVCSSYLRSLQASRAQAAS